MFLSGGSYSFQDGDTLARGMTPRLYYVALDLDDIESSLYSVNLNQTFSGNASLVQGGYEAIPMPSGVPYAVDFAPLFADNTTLYFYDPAKTTSDTIWGYNVSTSTWKDVPVASAGSNPPAPSTGGWASDPVTGRSFYLGTPDSALARRDIASPGLQMLDTSTSTPTWTSGIPGSPLLSAAQMVYVRSGEAGVLIAFGGVDPNDHSEFDSDTLGTYREMSQIFIFDIASKTWYNTTATGDVPVGRINMCAGVSSAPDDSSFQILVYGGYNLRFGNPANDMYVLSIPSFQWVKVTPPNPDPYGRWEHTCVVWQDAQMLVVGGLMKLSGGNGPVINANGCNSSHPPVVVIDTSDFTFQSQFSPQRSYSVPQAVYNVIGGDYRGLSSMKGPKYGFNNTNLDAIFSKTVPKAQAPTSFPPLSSGTAGTAASVSNTPDSSSSSSSTALSTAAIAGIAAGAAVLFTVGVVATAAFLLIRHRRRKAARLQEMNSYFGKPELDSSQSGPMALKPKAGIEGGGRRKPNMVHEADSGGDGGVVSEADAGGQVLEKEGSGVARARVVELNGSEFPLETGGRELSAEEARAYVEGRKGRRKG